MEKVTYIIPIHKYNKDVEKLLKRALESLANLNKSEGDKVMFVGPKDVIEKASKLYTLTNDLVKVENDETEFCKQINKAVFQCVTPYFSILEFDDAYKPYWNEVAQKYAGNGASILLPMIEVIQDGKMQGFGNEIAWSSSFANEQGLGLGFVDIDCLNTYMDFNVTGALVKTEDFISIGGLKPSMKIAAWYEFLLRAAYNSKNIFVVPKIGYEHTIEREDSFMANSLNEVSEEEGQWLITTAKQEYFFKEDRNKKFGETETSEA